jgi:hypothetical protein
MIDINYGTQKASHLNSRLQQSSVVREANNKLQTPAAERPSENALLLNKDDSDDEWADIQRLQALKHKEDQKKEKDARENKKLMIKNILDQQLKEKKNLKTREIQSKIEYESRLVKEITREQEEDKTKALKVKDKIKDEKSRIDQQLEEAHKKKIHEVSSLKKKEHNMVKKLQDEIAKEKEDKLNKRQKEKDTCL